MIINGNETRSTRSVTISFPTYTPKLTRPDTQEIHMYPSQLECIIICIHVYLCDIWIIFTIVSKLCFDSAEDNTSVRGQYQYQRIIPVSEDNTGIRGQYQYQRTIPVSEDNTSISGQYQYQRTIPVSEDNTSIKRKAGRYQKVIGHLNLSMTVKTMTERKKRR